VEILPQFASSGDGPVFKENEYLEVTAHDFDIHMRQARQRKKGDKAQWYNNGWAPATVTWDMVTYEVRLSALVLPRKIAEWPPAREDPGRTFPAF